MRLNSRVLGLNFLKDLAKRAQALHPGCSTDCDLKNLIVFQKSKAACFWKNVSRIVLCHNH